MARESSQPHVVAWGSSQPHVVALGSSQPHVEAWGSSQPHVEAWESSQPKLGEFVSALIHGTLPQVDGGRQTRVIINTPEQWCDYYSVTVADGIATLFKAVDDDYSTLRSREVGIFYRPGAVPVAPDWDGGILECGGGLHCSPRPGMALEFNPDAKRFVALPVALADIAVHPDGDYTHKVKVRGCCGPIYEVDRHGNPIKD